ncbi:hypothetical protein HanXRQr2_Chr08g0357251 [Helianthus annuus]|uniref:Uncharacterized protein n=1 Tax=Helianthus annuus TaxID=4232 RepID=A0A9K3II38_HELAN|nr:hypothetical protein HanXRQr2_Chr08g0357251 [Helianthus annuus]KAJ0903087.1 hypothetical protein HanPSC8_Chr08g0344951 [Helianthus annuus]
MVLTGQWQPRGPRALRLWKATQVFLLKIMKNQPFLQQKENRLFRPLLAVSVSQHLLAV